MTNLKKSYFTKRLIILATALLLAWVGISCKNKRPTEPGEMELERPDDKNDIIGGSDGMIPSGSDLWNKYKDEMINIRLISDSSDGVAYYRAPVVVAYHGANSNTGMAIFYEKRFGQGGLGDVGVDGNAKVDIVFMANGRGGDNLNYQTDNKVGSDPSASEDKQYSKGSPVVFVNGKEIAVVAAAGAGTMGDHRGGSEVKIVRGTASGDNITFGNWGDLDIVYSNNSTTYSNSAAIRQYAKDKIDGNLNSFYTRWGHGKMSDDKKTWVLPLKFMQRNSNGSSSGYGALLVLYSTNAGTNWTFGPHLKFGDTPYNEGLGLSVDSSSNVKVALVPRNPNNPVGIASASLTNGVTLSVSGTSSFNDSYNNFEMNKKDKDNAYFINTRERSSRQYNGFIVNKKLTIALLNDPAEDLKEKTSMLMSRLAGSGSVAVLNDGTIVTVAEEAFAEYVKSGENRYNIVQRRFTKEYVETHQRINETEEYYNPNFDENW